MIVRMAKIRVVGARERLAETLRVLQDFGLLHLAESTPHEPLAPMALSPRDLRRRRQLVRLVDDIQFSLEALGFHQEMAPAAAPAEVSDLARWARRALRVRGRVAELLASQVRLREERALIQRYRELLDALGPQLKKLARMPRVVTHAVVIPAAERSAAEEVIAAMRARGNGDLAVTMQPLRSGDIVVLIVMPARSAEKIERMLTEARLPEVPLPSEFRARSLTEAVPMMMARLGAIPREEGEAARALRAIAREDGPELERARVAAHDALTTLDAFAHCGTTARLFAIDGWVPEIHKARLLELLSKTLGPLVAVEELATEDWVGQDAPVVLTNPRLFRPFESLVRMMPLPRYGSIDPTPFVGVFFPVFFGLILGDVGYGLILVALGLVLHARAKPGSFARTAAEIMGPCAAVAIVCGVLFGEFFGDFGRHAFGMRAILFDREEALFAFLLVAVGLGVVHIVLGLVLGALTRWRHERRHAIGNGVSAVMVVLIVLSLLAALEVLPRAFLTPSVVALLVAFPLLVAVEGIIAPVEFLSTLGNILSYARVMALGVASVMLAVVANRMAGAVGSTVVGFLFALLFHLVNFAIGIFSPTIHALRLHYVEFFGKFYSPGGRPYQPLAHWRPTPSVSSK